MKKLPIETKGPLEVKYRYRGFPGSYRVEFSIGVQTFSVSIVETLKEVRWMHKQLHYALCNLLQAADQKRILFHLKTTRHIYHVSNNKRPISKRARESSKPKKGSGRSKHKT